MFINADGFLEGAWSASETNEVPRGYTEINKELYELVAHNREHPRGGGLKWKAIAGQLVEMPDVRQVFSVAVDRELAVVGDPPVVATITALLENGERSFSFSESVRFVLGGFSKSVSFSEGVATIEIPTFAELRVPFYSTINYRLVEDKAVEVVGSGNT